MSIAKDVLRFLCSKNVFRPKVLAQVRHNDRWFVGSSIAVSHFLRPLCLYRRIVNFKQPLQKAVISFQPINIEQTQDWSSAAFAIQNGCTRPKSPCDNCQSIFGNLKGFIISDSANKRDDTFLGACAEYCPVDKLLSDKEVISEDDKKVIHTALVAYKDCCSQYYESFTIISEKCLEAKGDVRKQEQVYADFEAKINILEPKYYRNLKQN